jgi:hypothetical protein
VARIREIFGLGAAVGLALATGAASGQDALQDRLGDFDVGDHWVYDDWEGALDRARKEGKPIFLVFRCVP